jgi:hypothetical protein
MAHVARDILSFLVEATRSSMVNKDNRVLNSHEVFRPLSIYNGICIRPTHSWPRSKEVLCSSVFALLEREGISGIPKQSQRCAMPVVRMLALYRPQISNIIGLVEFSAGVNSSVNARFYGRLCARFGRGVDDDCTFAVGGCHPGALLKDPRSKSHHGRRYIMRRRRRLVK